MDFQKEPFRNEASPREQKIQGTDHYNHQEATRAKKGKHDIITQTDVLLEISIQKDHFIEYLLANKSNLEARLQSTESDKSKLETRVRSADSKILKLERNETALLHKVKKHEKEIESLKEFIGSTNESMVLQEQNTKQQAIKDALKLPKRQNQYATTGYLEYDVSSETKSSNSKLLDQNTTRLRDELKLLNEYQQQENDLLKKQIRILEDQNLMYVDVIANHKTITKNLIDQNSESKTKLLTAEMRCEHLNRECYRLMDLNKTIEIENEKQKMSNINLQNKLEEINKHLERVFTNTLEETKRLLHHQPYPTSHPSHIGSKQRSLYVGDDRSIGPSPPESQNKRSLIEQLSSDVNDDKSDTDNEIQSDDEIQSNYDTDSDNGIVSDDDSDVIILDDNDKEIFSLVDSDEEERENNGSDNIVDNVPSTRQENDHDEHID